MWAIGGCGGAGHHSTQGRSRPGVGNRVIISEKKETMISIRDLFSLQARLNWEKRDLTLTWPDLRPGI